MKKIKSFIITLLIFIGVTVLAHFLIEKALIGLFIIGIVLAFFFRLIWDLIHDKFFNN
jgi:hypothetical protein